MQPNGDGTTIDRFTIDDLQRVRSVVANAAHDAGLTDTRSENLVTAVNEVAVNAVEHAGGHGSLSVVPSAMGVVVEVHDDGPGLPPRLNTALPGPEATGGRGIWLASMLCRQITIASDPSGVTVRLFMPRT
jgi:anti-sigma regulatory factor (Ser/Thr protein kinase)